MSVVCVTEPGEVEHRTGAVDEPGVRAALVLVVEKDAPVTLGGNVSEVRVSLLGEPGLRGGYCWWYAGHAENVADAFWWRIRADR